LTVAIVGVGIIYVEVCKKRTLGVKCETLILESNTAIEMSSSSGDLEVGASGETRFHFDFG
jgi:hypothetical protein